MITYRKSLKQRARNLRKNSTMGERMLWKRLNKKQLFHTFNRQKRLGNYIVDFYCHELQLVIEIDGFSHNGNGEQDLHRQSNLESMGLKVVRFSEKEVIQNIDNVTQRIFWWIETHENTPSLRDTPLKKRGLRIILTALKRGYEPCAKIAE